MNQVYYGDPYGYGSAAGAAAGILGGFAIFGILMMAVGILMLVSMWKVFTKCGKPGWASIVPLYNMFVLTEIAGVAWWYILLFCVPIANLYAMFVIYNNIAQKFGKSTGFTIGMMIVPFVFWPMLAFSKDASAVETLDMQPMESTPIATPISTSVETTNASAPVMGAPIANEFNTFAQPVASEPVVQAPVEPAPMVNDFNAFAQPVVNEPINQMPVQEPVMQAPVEPAPMVNDFDAFAQPVVNEPINQMPVQEPVMQAPVQNTYVSSEPINNNQMNNNNNIQF